MYDYKKMNIIEETIKILSEQFGTFYAIKHKDDRYETIVGVDNVRRTAKGFGRH